MNKYKITYNFYNCIHDEYNYDYPFDKKELILYELSVLDCIKKFNIIFEYEYEKQDNDFINLIVEEKYNVEDYRDIKLIIRDYAISSIEKIR